ncbi:L-fucose mutarotase [Vibrio tapetis]|uniref:L-fucose mutarotase n=1 Tax=Vibrio tapetis subsp. tapetis TaxID=1671868 RepID=A0A2N8ZCZ8_9VIBR|nr:L-fucose mutarotase [Vibrio tapetis]SON49763.1 L-fucose mutarotase [Vibrio tapetis subsp. tapetis]
MLKGIHPAISPELLSVLSRMGHGDEILFADAHFPAETFGSNVVIRADGIDIDTLLEGTLPLFELDSYSQYPLAMMRAVEGDELDPAVEEKYMAAIVKTAEDKPALERLERFDFYTRAEKCFAVVVTGETAKYGNIILKKGVTPA